MGSYTGFSCQGQFEPDPQFHQSSLWINPLLWGVGREPTSIDPNDWNEYIGSPPPPSALCRFKQGDNGNPWVGYRKDFHPELNIANLKWRYTGIAKQEREDYDSK